MVKNNGLKGLYLQENVIHNSIFFFFCRFEATRLIRRMEMKANEQPMNGGSTAEGRDAEWHVPILAMTADVIHATYDECLKCGMDGYVSKPFEEENLYQAVASFFESKHNSEP